MMLMRYSYGSPENRREALELMRVSALRQMIACVSVPDPPSRKDDIVNWVERHVDRRIFEEAWQTLDELQQRAVQEAVHDVQGELNVQMFRAKYGKMPKDFNNTGVEKASTLSLFLYPQERYSRYGSYVPPDVRELLQKLVPEPPEAIVESVHTLPETVHRGTRFGSEEDRNRRMSLDTRHMALAALHDLTATLRLVDQGKVSVSASTRRANQASMLRIASVLQGGDFFDVTEKKENSFSQVPGPVRSFAWPLLLQAGRLARVNGSKLELTKAGRKALTEVGADSMRHLLDKWLGTNLLDEFNRVEGIKGQQSKGHMTKADSRRDLVFDALALCPVGGWVKIDEFNRFMRANNFMFEVTRDPWRLYIGHKEYGSLGYESYGEWDMIQGRYVGCLLFEYAATLGMIDVAFTRPECARSDFLKVDDGGGLTYLSRYDGFEYFRLNELGAYVLGIVDQYAVPKPDSAAIFNVHGDLRIQVLQPMSGEEHVVMDLWASKQSERVWQIDREKALLALQAGHTVDDLRDFLAARDDQFLPEQVEAFLTKVARDAHAMKFEGMARVFACESAVVADRICADRKLAKMCLRAGEDRLVVLESKWNAFARAVHQIGLGIQGQ